VGSDARDGTAEVTDRQGSDGGEPSANYTRQMKHEPSSSSDFSASRVEHLEELVTGAAILMELFEGYMGPQWFELMHDAQLSYPDKIKAEAEVILNRRHIGPNAAGEARAGRD
jgi:hypothetical protein